MKPLKVTREIANTIGYVCDCMSTETWFKWWELYGYHRGESQLEDILTFDENELEGELLECAENDGELQATFDCMTKIWAGAYRDILDKEDFRGWYSKYGSEEAGYALERLNELDNAHGKIERKLVDIKIRYGLKFNEENKQPTTKTNKPQSTFRGIIQYHDPDKLLQRLHQLIDGKKGADVGSVLLKAKQDGLITRNPYKEEFEDEFKGITLTSAIKNYMSDNNENALDRANRIVIFD